MISKSIRGQEALMINRMSDAQPERGKYFIIKSQHGFHTLERTQRVRVFLR